ncbi:MAG: nucleotidyl transferase AbiEii/AbiGii toxin family protein, partial [Prochlorococcaceae cyanobacterium]
MNAAYTTTVRQLLDIAPVVFSSPHFAIKGGTAINLFLHDLPRLSVDIDVVFTNHRLNRAAAFEAIATELSAISQNLEAMGYEVL